MSDGVKLLLIALPFAAAAAVFSYWWTRFMIRMYRKWAR